MSFSGSYALLKWGKNVEWETNTFYFRPNNNGPTKSCHRVFEACWVVCPKNVITPTFITDFVSIYFSLVNRHGWKFLCTNPDLILSPVHITINIRKHTPCLKSRNCQFYTCILVILFIIILHVFSSIIMEVESWFISLQPNRKKNCDNTTKLMDDVLFDRYGVDVRICFI